MSDLSNLFVQRQKPSTPIKRLFLDEFSTAKKQSQVRSREPNKSIRKYKEVHHNHTSLLKSKDFAKRYLQKQDLKKEIISYNHLILLTFIRKMFFIMGGVILLNILLTQSDQLMITCNMIFALSFVDINLGKDLLGSSHFTISKELIKTLVYCINFHLIFMKVHSLKPQNSQPNQEALFISINALLNYIVLTLCEPFIVMERINNHKKPYVSYLQKAKLQVYEFWTSIKTIYYLRRPIILLNLFYWLFIVIYIIYERSDQLLNSLLNVETLKAFFLSTFLLYLFLYTINKINETMSIELLSPNKKAINLSILRLDCENSNNQIIANEILKYIWKNCEIVWDIQLLSHNYSINYDILEDYLNLELLKINEKVMRTFRNLSIQGKNNKNGVQNRFSFIKCIRNSVQQLKQVHKLADFIKNKQYIFYIIHHMIIFEAYTNDFPINMKIIRKKIITIDDSLKLLYQDLSFYELRRCVQSFAAYFHEKITRPLTQ